MDGITQLEQEIRRHLALATLTDGVVREDHQEAARALTALLAEIGGDRPSQKSRSASGIRSRLRDLLGRKPAP